MEIEIQSKSTLVQKKFRQVNLKLRAHKQIFEISDLLSRVGTFPKVEEFLEDKMKKAVLEYLDSATSVVEKASNVKPRSLQKVS